jgi:hypothetical protein
MLRRTDAALIAQPRDGYGPRLAISNKTMISQGTPGAELKHVVGNSAITPIEILDNSDWSSCVSGMKASIFRS